LRSFIKSPGLIFSITSDLFNIKSYIAYARFQSGIERREAGVLRIVQIKSFVWLVEIDNFNRTADALYITQSALSKQIALLERELGTKLLIRKSRGIELTRDGREFLNFAQIVDKAYDDLLSNIQKRNKKRVTMVTIPASLWVFSPILDRFSAENPDVELVMHEREQDEVLSAAAELGADAILAWDNLIPDTEFTIIPLIPSLLCIGVSKDHPLANVDKVPLYTMANQPFVMLHQAGIRKFLTKVCRDAGFIPDVQYQVTTNDTMLRFIREGKAIGFIYAPVHDGDPEYLEGIHPIKLNDPVQSAMSLALPKGRVSQPMQMLADYMKRSCEQKY
jgi:DNA-binding transcriptional LysR family regulator